MLNLIQFQSEGMVQRMIHKRMSEQRAGLKSFQATAQAHRKALVAEAAS
jgi:hypothetical protein